MHVRLNSACKCGSMKKAKFHNFILQKHTDNTSSKASMFSGVVSDVSCSFMFASAAPICPCYLTTLFRSEKPRSKTVAFL